MSSTYSLDRIWRNLRCILERPGPFKREEFEPSVEALMGFSHLEVIDMDTIDVSNLNRQFLFRPTDVGSPKAEVAAKYIMNRIPYCKVIPHYKKIQDFDEDFYRQFNAVVCGLDSIIARRWINSMLASLVCYDENDNVDPNTVVPLVDGGTEGFKGHVLVVLYGITGCLECSLDLYPPQVNFPLCTIAHTPRLPEHCVEYVKLLLWEKENPFGAIPIDGDLAEHIQWIYEQSLIRAKQFGIVGITLRLVQGVVKRIIPAVASTNAIIAAACATEVFKIVTFCYNYLDNYINFSNIEGVYTYSFSVERKDDCIACNNVPRQLFFNSISTLRDILEYLKNSPLYQMQSPSITTVENGSNRSLFIDLPDFVDKLRPNLSKTLKELNLINGQMFQISDSTTPRTLTMKLNLDKANKNLNSDFMQIN